MDKQEYLSLIAQFNRTQAEQVERLLQIVSAATRTFGVVLGGHQFYPGVPTPYELRVKIATIFPPIGKAPKA